MGAVTEDEFSRVARGLRWSDRNLRATRALLVDGQSPREAADANKMTEQQASVLRRRFLEKVQVLRATKVSVDDFLASRPSLDLFKPALLKLRRRGLSDEQLLDYLSQNELKATLAELRAAIGAAPSRRQVKPHANHDVRKPKRRSR
jgi:hypothetical protein